MDETKKFSNKGVQLRIITIPLAHDGSHSITEPIKISYPEIIKQGVQRVENLVRFPNLEIPVFLHDVFPAFKEYLLFFEGLRQPFFRQFFRIILPQLDNFFGYLLDMKFNIKRQLTLSEAVDFLRVFPYEVFRGILDIYNDRVGLTTSIYSELIDAFEKKDFNSFRLALARVESNKLMKTLWLHKQILLIASTETTLWPNFSKEIYNLEYYKRKCPNTLKGASSNEMLYSYNFDDNDEMMKYKIRHSILGDYHFAKMKRGCFMVTEREKEDKLIKFLIYLLVRNAYSTLEYYNTYFNLEHSDDKFEHYDTSWNNILTEYLQRPEYIDFLHLTDLTYNGYALAAEDYHNYILCESASQHKKMIVESDVELILYDCLRGVKKGPNIGKVISHDEVFMHGIGSVIEENDFNSYDESVFYKYIILYLHRISFVYNISKRFFTAQQNKELLRIINYSPLFADRIIGDNSLFNKMQNIYFIKSNSIVNNLKASGKNNPLANDKIEPSEPIEEGKMSFFPKGDRRSQFIMGKLNKYEDFDNLFYDVLHHLYRYLKADEKQDSIDELPKNKKAYIDSNEADFINILGGKLKDGEKANEDPKINWIGKQNEFYAFVYSYFGGNKNAKNEYIYDIEFKNTINPGVAPFTHCFRWNDEQKKLSGMKDRDAKNVQDLKNKWMERFEKICNYVIKKRQ